VGSLPPWLQRTEPPSVEELIDQFDLWAFLCCTVSNRQGIEVPFIENPMQRRINQIEDAMRREKGYAWLYELKMRRGGLSMNTQLRNLWRVWRRPNTRGITLAHEDESTNEIFQITRLAMQRFPQNLLHPMSRERQRAVNFLEQGSRFLTGTAGTIGLGRGSDYSFLHVSEFAFVAKPKALHTSASQALRADGTYILETTASAYGSEPHVMWQEAREGRSKFKAVFFEWWWRDDAYLPLLALDELEPLDDKEQLLAIRIARFQAELLRDYYNVVPDPAVVRRRALEQLKWRRDKISEIGLQEFDREYPEDDTSCWLIAGTPRFDTAALRWARENTIREPLRREWNDELRIYAEPDPNKRYLLGGDPSEGVEGDRAALQVLEEETKDQVATFSSRTTPPETLADKAAILGRRYASARYGPAVMVPERNAAGHTMLYQLLRVMKPAYPKNRIWHKTKQVQNKRLSEPGWRTDEENKYIAIDEGDQLIRERRNILHDKETIEDLLSVQRGKNGTVELTGKDCAMSWLLAYQGRKHPIMAMPTGEQATDGKSEAATIAGERY
jgi:hypothetical protein